MNWDLVVIDIPTSAAPVPNNVSPAETISKPIVKVKANDRKYKTIADVINAIDSYMRHLSLTEMSFNDVFILFSILLL